MAKINNPEDLDSTIYETALQSGTLTERHLKSIPVNMKLTPDSELTVRDFVPGLYLLVGSANAGKTYFYKNVIDASKNQGALIVMDEPVPGAIFSPKDISEWYAFVKAAQESKHDLMVVDSFSALIRKRLDTNEDTLSSGIAGNVRQRFGMLSSRLAEAGKLMFAAVNTDDLGRNLDIAQFLEGGVEGIIRISADRTHSERTSYAAAITYRTFEEESVLGTTGLIEGKRPTEKLYEYTVDNESLVDPDDPEEWY